MRKSTSVLFVLTALALVALTSALPAQTLTITSPATNALVPVGTRCRIGWASTNLAGRTLKIEVSMAGAAPHYSVANSVPVEAGQYQWDIPWEVPPTNPCQVYIAIFDDTNKVGSVWGPEFSLVSNPAPALLVRAPAGGEPWPRGTTRSVSWEPHNLSGTLTLDLLQGGTVVESVAGLTVASNRCHYALPAGLPSGSNYSLRLTSDAVLSVAASSSPFQVTDQAPPKRKWTMLFYLDADCFNMEQDTMQSIVELGQLSGSTNVNYVIQVDRSPAYATTYGNWFDTKRFVVRPGLVPTPAYAAQSLGELNMSSPQTLTDFINWGTDNFPAENYFLILADHGWGWAEGLITDESNGNKQMSTRGFSSALTAADVPMTILGIDMCVEGQIEIAHQVRNSGAQIYIASQFIETRNWPYLTVFQQLESKLATLTPEALAILFCDAYVQQFSDPTVNATLAATRLDQVNALTAAVAGLADAMITNATDQAAVRQQAAATKAAFHDAVIYCARSKILDRQVYGLNIDFPLEPPNPAYGTTNVVDFGVDSHWATFLTAYQANLTNSWIAGARALVAKPDATEVDLLRFLEAIQPEPTNAWVTFQPVGDGVMAPFGPTSVTLPKGTSLTIRAWGNVDTNNMPIHNHFVRWHVSGDVQLNGDPLVATNTLTISGDGLVMAFFSEDKETYDVTFITQGNGRLNGASEVVLTNIPAGGSCPTITAVPDAGYTFAGWGGDYPATANPFTLTNVQADMTVIAYFWQTPPTLSVERTGSSLTLTWSADATGYALESSGDLVSGPWTAVPNVTTNSVTLPLSNTNQFFRLSATANQQN